MKTVQRQRGELVPIGDALSGMAERLPFGPSTAPGSEAKGTE